MAYFPHDIEPKWQKYWQDHTTFQAKINANKKKYYALDMFPYPSAQGLHVGHPEGYTATDIISRYKRMRGFNVLHCMGWDAFGLPAEQHALQTGTHPAITTKKNVANFKRQIKALGFSYDWDREINTTDPNYYQWTQWIFLQLYQKGLAKREDALVNWCPKLGTVLANEEVIDGKSERGGFPVERRPMRQWILKITEYADRLLEDLESLDWPESIKEMQRNWIGKSEGAIITFKIENTSKQFEVFTTRPDTLFGSTYCVLAPEHPLVQEITSPQQKESIEAYQKICVTKSDLDRTELTKEKTGVFTGAYAIHPVNQKRIPIWIADYVLMTYGTGSIMAVPAHDTRDYEFAKTFDLEIIQVIEGGNIHEAAYTGDGNVINSDFLNSLSTQDAKQKMIAWLEKNEKGKKSIHYKLRDWLFSRQRYWGEPFPILMDEEENVFPMDEADLPLILPDIQEYKPSGSGESPLARNQNWVNIEKQDGTKLRRETNTMPQWAGSCWYYLRFIDPLNSKQAWSKEAEEYWMPVDLYIGGAEHAVLHLLYARFWHKVLYDLGYVHTKEPFQKLVNQGMITGEDGRKMSKSLGNVINPDDMIEKYGADSVRLYEMFMGPLEKSKPWQTNGIDGIYRFLQRIWRMILDENNLILPSIQEQKASIEENKILHQTIKKVTEDIEKLHFNTAISQMMVFVNQISTLPTKSKQTIRTFVLLLSPFAPHLAEELWEKLGGKNTLAYEKWPQYNADFLIEQETNIPIQINGKVRDQILVQAESSKEEILEKAKQQPKLQKYLQQKTIHKVIFVKNKILNIVVKN